MSQTAKSSERITITSASFEDYVVRGGHRHVEGWIEDGALNFLTLLNAYQMGRGIKGSIAEIGVHHGRCFIALCTMRRADEFGVAADIFEHQELNPDSSGRGDYSKFMSNLKTFGVADHQAVLAGDSLALKGQDIIDAAKGQRIRLFSVDGSHTAKHTANDLEVAAAALAPNGVVVLDDWYNPDWPGVEEGYFAFARRRGCALAPFAYGNGKLYLTRTAARDDYLRYVSESIRPVALHWKEVELSGFRCHHVRLPSPDLIRGTTNATNITELDVRNPAPASGALGTGWAAAEAWGRWTLGNKAEFAITVPPGQGAEFELRARLASFFSEIRPRQVVSINRGDQPLGEWLVENTIFAWKQMPIRVPPEFSEPTLNFTMSFLATQSPKEVGLSDDQRELGIRVSTLELRRVPN